jgi:hypothetical protein
VLVTRFGPKGGFLQGGRSSTFHFLAIAHPQAIESLFAGLPFLVAIGLRELDQLIALDLFGAKIHRGPIGSVEIKNALD